jgi:serine-type D-Ala-D-Ala endopeptidase (penicillin-binding protein 7)
MQHSWGKACRFIVLLAALIAAQQAGPAPTPAAAAAHGRHGRPAVATAPRSLVLRSAAAVVEDQRTGEVLLQKQPDVIHPIASITKLMTAMVILDSGMNLQEPSPREMVIGSCRFKLMTAMVILDSGMNLQEPITISRGDVDTFRHSHSRLPVGTRLTREDALLLALMASENRAAHALGRAQPGGSPAFVAAMNAKARSLGLTRTRFADSAGLSCANVSSARDLARMVGAAYRYPLIRDFSTRESTVIQSGRRMFSFRNTNRLIRSPHWKIGLSKTGFIDEAGRCLVMQAEVAQRPLVFVLLDAQGTLTRFADANRIKQWMEGCQTGRRKQSRAV